MGNLSGRSAIEIANAVFGICPESGILNLVFEILDGTLVVETVDGDPGVDMTDDARLRLLMGCAVFGGKSARITQRFHELPDGEEALDRFHALIDGLEGTDEEEGLLAMKVNAHPELRTLVVFTLEQGQDGARVHRLYRNPNLSREEAVGFLRKMREEFRARSQASGGSDISKN